MRQYIEVICFIMAIIVSGCTSHKATQKADSTAVLQTSAQNSRPQAAFLPKAVIYKTNGNYSDNVHVNLTADGTRLSSYPAPTDITVASSPVELGEGWYYDRQGGINSRSAFLKYTYEQYAALNTVSPSSLLGDIIGEAHVIDCIQTPLTYSEANANPDLLKKYIPTSLK